MSITRSITRAITRSITRSTTAPHSGASPIFNLPLKTTLRPSYSRGSGTATFTRATTAYVSDSDGILRQAVSGEARFSGSRRVRNLVSTKSEDWTNVAWTKTIGTVAATTLTATGANQTVLQTYTGTGNYVLRVRMSRITGTGDIDLTLDGGSTWTTVVLTSSAQTFSIAQTAVTNPQFGIRIVTSGDAINADRIQLEATTGQSNTNPSEYVSVGVLSAPFHGANVDSVRYFSTANGNTVASNVVTEATGAALADATLLGYLAEGQRTNLCLQSNEFDEAVWTSTNVTVDDQSVAAPDGTTTADTLTAAAADATLIQDLGVIASAVKVFSVYLKRKTGTGAISLTLDGGSTWTAKTITATWVRYEITQTLADPDCGIKITTDTDAVYAWGAQVEAASFASSAIPTTTAAVTRNADVLTYPLTGNFSNTAGSAYAEAATLATVGAAVGNDFGLLLIRTTPRVEGFDGTNAPTCSVTGSVAVQIKVAAKWGAGSYQVFGKGSAGTATAYDGAFGPTSLQIGNANSGVQPFANVRNVRIYPTALSAAKLQAMTA